MEDNEPVLVPGILLSDQVIREAGTNKLSLIGMFSVWNAVTFPFTCPQFFITPLLTNFKKGGVTLPVTVRVETVEKHVLWNATAKLNLHAGSLPSHAIIDASIPVVGLTFQAPGRYIVRVLADGEELGQRDLHVLSVTSPPPQVK